MDDWGGNGAWKMLGEGLLINAYFYLLYSIVWKHTFKKTAVSKNGKHYINKKKSVLCSVHYCKYLRLREELFQGNKNILKTFV